MCAIPLGRHEACPSPACPCYGTRAGSAEMDAAAQRWRSRPSVAQARTLDGRAALDALERRAWLELTAAYGAVIDVEITHEPAP